MRPPPHVPSDTATPSHINNDNKRRSSPYNDRMLKVFMALVIVAGTINIAIFGRYADTIPERHLPFMHLPDSTKDQRKTTTTNGAQDVSEVDFQRNVNAEKFDTKKNGKELIDQTTERAANADDKDRIKNLIKNADVEVTPEIASSLPSWSSVVAQYGSEPVIVGLDTCDRFRSTVSRSEAMAGTAGIFNTGTNLVSTLMRNNCFIPDKGPNWRGIITNGMEWQVPWGKHSPATWRYRHAADGAKLVNQTAVLPIVVVKDPFHWMGSMCRKSYVCNWRHTKLNCPNLVINGEPNEARVRYSPENRTSHTSLVGVWNDYYKQYLDASFPRLIIRFEDLLFHPEYVVTKACECVGGQRLSDKIKNVRGNAKGGQPAHEGGSDLMGAITRYGDYKKRAEGFSEVDRNYAESAINKELAYMFHYKVESRIEE